MEKNTCIEWLESIGFERHRKGYNLWWHAETGIMCLLSDGQWIALVEGLSDFSEEENYPTAKEAIEACIEQSRQTVYELHDTVDKADHFISRYQEHTPEEIAWLVKNGYEYDVYDKHWWKNSGGKENHSLPAFFLSKKNNLWEINFHGYKDNHQLQTVQLAEAIAHQLYKQMLIDKIASTKEQLQNFQEAIGEIQPGITPVR